MAENGVNVDPAEKAKEDEINATIKRLVDNKKEKAVVAGEKITKTQIKAWEKTARATAENSYRIKHPAKKSVEKEGTEIGE